jgi:DNA methylase
VVVLDHLSETQRRAYIIADNKLAQNAGWDEATLADELRDLEAEGLDLALVGFSDAELEELLAKDDQPHAAAESDEDEVPEAPVNPVTRPGDIWVIGPHRLICGDCRDLTTVEKLLAGARANVCITSPPYATQREYDATSGFKPIPPQEYVNWYGAVAANAAAVLAPDGSYFLNIKEHAEDGERSLYVKDLVLAHKRAWGWRFVDEFCWRKTDNGVPGGRTRVRGLFRLLTQQSEVHVGQWPARHGPARRGGGWRQEPVGMAAQPQQFVPGLRGPIRGYRAPNRHNLEVGARRTCSRSRVPYGARAHRGEAEGD